MTKPDQYVLGLPETKQPLNKHIYVLYGLLVSTWVAFIVYGASNHQFSKLTVRKLFLSSLFQKPTNRLLQRRKITLVQALGMSSLLTIDNCV